MTRQSDLGMYGGSYLGELVDQWMPCIMFRSLTTQGPNAAGTVERSDNSGRTWRSVFVDYAVRDPMRDADGVVCPGPSCPFPQFNLSGMYQQGPGQIVLGENAVGDRFVWSDDSGASWTLRNGGMESLTTAGSYSTSSQTYMTYSIAFGSDRSTAYAYRLYRDVAHEPLLTDLNFAYVTRDAGHQWTPLKLPPDALGPGVSAAVDPASSAHAWMITQPVAGGYKGARALLETHDFGASWTKTYSFRSCPFQLAALALPGGGVRIASVADKSGGNLACPGDAGVSISDDAGVTWRPVSLPRAFTATSLINDPVDARRVLLFDGSSSTTAVRFAYSTDGLATTAAIPGPSTWNVPHFDQRDTTATLVPSLQADRDGHFYVALLTGCQPQLCNGTTAHDLWELTPPSLPLSGTNSPSIPTTTTSSQTSASAGYAPAVQQCQLPDDTGLVTSPSPTDPKTQPGSLAYDGQDLLATYGSDLGRADLPPYSAVIRKFDPSTCTDDGEIVVGFDAQELQAVQRQNDINGTGIPQDDPARPFIDNMTYDAKRNVLWAFTGHSGSTGIFTITLSDPRPHGRSTAIGRLAFLTGENSYLAYMFSSDTLWTLRPASRAGNAQSGALQIDATSGSPLATCVDRLYSVTNGSLVGWTAGAPARLWVLEEDDIHMMEIDTSTCSIVSVIEHPLYQEPTGEDEQLACDALSFTTSPASPSTLWLRAPQERTMSGYSVTGNKCPFPTFTSYLGPSRAGSGQSIRLCAAIHIRYLEGIKPLFSHESVEFLVDGQEFGFGLTDGAHETLCTPPHPAPSAGGAHVVSVRFAGDDHYLPSYDIGALEVASAAIPPVFHSPAGLALPAGPPDSPFNQVPEAPPTSVQTAGQSNLQAQAEAQVQAQSQIQSQAHTMAQVQPGMMMQAQRRTQVATQAQEASVQATYHATPLQRGQAPLTGAAAAFLMLGLGVLGRRPRWASARAARDGRSWFRARR